MTTNIMMVMDTIISTRVKPRSLHPLPAHGATRCVVRTRGKESTLRERQVTVTCRVLICVPQVTRSERRNSG